MNSTTSRTIAIIGILAIALTVAGCSPRDAPVTSAPPSPPQAMQQSHPVENPREPKETDEQAAAAQGTIVEVDQGNFEQEVIQADIPVVVDFWADWCAPCHMIRPTLEQLARYYAGKLKFVSVDKDANPKLAKQFHVVYLPTIVIIQDGQETQRFVGALPPKQLYEKITEVLPSDE